MLASKARVDTGISTTDTMFFQVSRSGKETRHHSELWQATRQQPPGDHCVQRRSPSLFDPDDLTGQLWERNVKEVYEAKQWFTFKRTLSSAATGLVSGNEPELFTWRVVISPAVIPRASLTAG
ncbi:hypothetical protein RRG08_059491 [Elysia crispata]|uniref:Uncharacterized protein n=1 Tax=Elysia crispata TaxID=231223 RepID=A0AAE1A4C8_9GAST|nr:hypothetical protein RRG08_059491 [Elysia crispata]